MQRLWFLMHMIVTYVGARFAHNLTKPTRAGELDHHGQLALDFFRGFCLFQFISALLLFVVLKRTQGGLNVGLVGVSWLWMLALLVGTEINTMTF